MSGGSPIGGGGVSSRGQAMRSFTTTGALRWAVMALLAGACRDGASAPMDAGGTDTGGTTGPVTTGPASGADELYSLRGLPEFRIELGAAAWAALEADPKAWVPGSFEYDGVVYDDVGVRLKGNHSLRPLDDKPSFKIKFDEYVDGRQFLGLEEVVLNNMVVDRSMMREWLGYRVFRELGAPAPRAGYATLVVNGMDYGLYLNLEAYEDAFLERVYDDPDGNLYEEEGSADVQKEPERWDQDGGADKSRDDLRALQALVLQDDDAVFYGASAVIDMPRLFAFVIAEVITGQFDGYIAAHNFYIYHEVAPDLWSFLPWSLDQGMNKRSGPYDHEGFLVAKCLHSRRCLVDYVKAAKVGLGKFAALDLAAEIDRIEALTDAAMAADPRKPYTAEVVREARGGVRYWLAGREAELRPALDCLVDGVEPDADGDGYGPCFQDCDEGDAAVNPDALEACDGRDNDCSRYIDDVPACECPSRTVEGRTFYACDNVISWTAAEAFCAAQGRTLAQFDSEHQQEEVYEFAEEIRKGRWAIGLADREVEDDYRWPDGSAPAFDAWAEHEPAHTLEWFDCVLLRGGRWYEVNCVEKSPFLCSD